MNLNIFKIPEIKYFFWRLINIRLGLINNNLDLFFLGAINRVEHALIGYLVQVLIHNFVFRLSAFFTRAPSSAAFYRAFFGRSSRYLTVVLLFAFFKLLEHFHDIVLCFFLRRAVLSVQLINLFYVVLDLLVDLDFVLVDIYVWNVWCSCKTSLCRAISKLFDFLIVLKRWLLFTYNIFTRLVWF